ncbi:penicillin-binding protein 1B [Colwelliaceae bacterium 6471]
MPKTKIEQSVVSDKAKQSPKLKRLLWFFCKLALVVLVILAFYTLYLDSKVRHTFEGQRWQVPVQVFSQIEQFDIGSPIHLANTKKSLLLAGYKKVARVNQPGEFAMSANRLILFRRAFDFGSGLEPEQQITINAHNGYVQSIQQDNAEVNSTKLEPLLLDRILPQSKEDRVIVPLQNVPEKLLDTLLLVEDRNFYFHHGISPLGIMRALYNNLRAGRTVQGGSTLTQQLVKNMFLTRDKTLWRKVNEAIMSLILEQRYSKDQLLEAYINEVYLGQHYANGIYGFGLASQFYFGKPLAHLTDEQMALLIGQVKGPSYYDPWRYPEHALERRDLILRLMFEQNILSRVAFERAVESPLSIRKNRRFVKQKYPAYLQIVKRELTEILSEEEQQSGIRVFTGFSPLSQKIAEHTVDKKLPELEAKYQQADLQAAMVVADIASGEIRAVVGGRESGYAGFNRALQAKRPIGSLVKPAVYLAAMERYARFNFATLLDDKAITLTSDSGDEWRPKNYDGKYRGQVNLIDALVHSLNIPTVNLGMQLGLDNVASAIHLLGYPQDIVMRPSMLLGALNMSPFEVNQLYLPIAAGGIYEQEHAITHISSAKGETIWRFVSAHEQRVSSQAAYLLDYALTQVTTDGTAKSLTWRLKDKSLAGKTGTSNEQRDSWFIGYDNKHLVTTWVGRDDNKPTQLTGSSGALILFADYMKQQGVINKNVEVPDGIVMTSFELKTGNAVAQNCANTIEYPTIAQSIVITPDCLQPVKDNRSWFEKIFGD